MGCACGTEADESRRSHCLRDEGGSPRCPAAINDEILASHVGTGLLGEENDSSLEFLGFTHATHEAFFLQFEAGQLVDLQ